MRHHATLVRTDDSDDPGQPIEYSVQVPVTRRFGLPPTTVEVGRLWLDSEADEWVALTTDKTAPPIGRYPHVLDAVHALIHHPR